MQLGEFEKSAFNRDNAVNQLAPWDTPSLLANRSPLREVCELRVSNRRYDLRRCLHQHNRAEIFHPPDAFVDVCCKLPFREKKTV